ncbi:MAG: CcoQ/FixQ family Cbb3-type cytochrome c oxidase assembly chaperone [Thalassotalea sp.]|uniref:cbb3-type cytochrome oxidase subunit 3 n=1 Tax=Thalassomonas sp. M1454 TaxID=2594477 RepID=UPI00117F2C22|nr:CcoQ/FixQ family Cbb3-type cytochrome c oxidase assembly chaperone [Thalassomonas sp. M1454]MDG1733881.1 CcoQ/FixQ family Cbb3-type cytochrome c oxidase assembly chaperone [Thalassotalea sp.]MDG2393203.1 CcoQ/FixQ family Cbb3-type cytochrome c oxidase assembly chaperone [Thalassotalea sp.]TRX56958.1 cbb3-type cytochrome oxidase subunit 3 [Thalassomonas sp. M1454]
MDYGTLRGIFTVLIFVLFIIIVLWAYSKNRKSKFDKIANSIFDENDDKEVKNKQETNNNV